MIQLFGFDIPIWLLMLIGIAGIILVWRLIKFALTILIIVILLLIIVSGLDFLGVFQTLQNLINGLI